MTRQTQIIGLIRFSYAGETGWAGTLSDSDAERARLYDPARLERRLALFEALTVPCLLAQTDPAFDLVVLTGAALPDWASARLETALKDLSGVTVIKDVPRRHYAAVSDAIDTVRSGVDGTVVTFRLDDDDALDISYVQRLRQMAGRMAWMIGSGRPVALSFHRGFHLTLRSSGNLIEPVCERSAPASGTALLAPADWPHNVYLRNHRLLPQFFNTLSDADDVVSIRTVHGDNDATPEIKGRREELSVPQVDRLLEEGFGLSRAALMAL